jgi:hypothetical protein
MLALMLAVERFAARHEHDLFLTIDHWNWRQTSRQAGSRPDRQPRILCLGDSQVQVGVASAIVESQTGRKVSNLAISGGQAASSYFLLRRALGAGEAPDAILVDFFPRLLQASPLEGVDPWTSLTRVGECADLAWTARDPGFFARVALGRILPTVRARDAIRRNLSAALRGERNDDRQHVPAALRRNLARNGGGVLCPAQPGRTEDLDAWSRRNFPAEWTCHPVNRAYLRRFLALASSRKIPVFWLLPPVEPALQVRCEASGFDARHEAFVRDVRAEFPEVTVLDARRSAYDRSVFFDPHHLAREGAAAYSADLAREVRLALDARASGPGWVELPAYRPAPVELGGPLEDLEQSRVALRARRAGLRR